MFASAHTFCASRNALFNLHATCALRVDIEEINYAVINATKVKAKFSYFGEIRTKESALKPGTPK